MDGKLNRKGIMPLKFKYKIVEHYDNYSILEFLDFIDNFGTDEDDCIRYRYFVQDNSDLLYYPINWMNTSETQELVAHLQSEYDIKEIERIVYEDHKRRIAT